MNPTSAEALADQFAAAFRAAGATVVLPDLLQPAGALLDLYGEDIRARAYVTHDPDAGELMLRPDFTVPVVLHHLQAADGPARYTYSGPVFRVPPVGSGRPRGYLQVGYESIGDQDRAAADAEVYGLFARSLAPFHLSPVTGDMGVLIAAIDSLRTTAGRKRALRRHLWRPQRFRALFDRFAGRGPAPAGRAALVQAVADTGAAALIAAAEPAIGRRGTDEIAARLAALCDDAAAPPIPPGQADALDAVLNLRASLPDAAATLHDMAVELPQIAPAVARLTARCAALAGAGIDVDALPFEARFGRTNMEYYDGFVFGFLAPTRPDLPPVATGGRYDALTAMIGRAAPMPAVGGVLRPETLIAATGTEGVAG
ncbi:MAG: ATP phosphoribosyltransferase regulatory subunit [Pseudomonadota bacterium]